MIKHLRISNFAIIENIDIDFNQGLNIITGETGSGKSIVIEAISLALGARADTAFVRTGCDKATIQMVVDSPEVSGDDCVISREISSSGRSLCKINSDIVNLSTLSEFCGKVADIHGQYDHQSLLNPDCHISLVDLYKKDLTGPAKQDVFCAYNEYSDIKTQLSSLKKIQAEGTRQKDFMEFELNELTDANLIEGEDSELEEKISVLQNSEKIYNNLAGAYQVASESEFSLLSAMKQVSDMVAETSEFSSGLENLSGRLNELYYEYEDACTTIREQRDNVVFDQDALDSAIERLDTLNRLKSKHGKSITELLAYADELDSKISQLVNSDIEIQELQDSLDFAAEKLADACESLGKARRKSAHELESLITSELKELGFNNAELFIKTDKSEAFTPDGNDLVEFLISTNKGEKVKPLSKIASGGEMSRIMLAFKKIIGDYDAIPTMIFDEIDSGISGIAASVVGRKLNEIAESHQIICITHLPQIAAHGRSNYCISKHSDSAMTYTSVDLLSEEEKVHEIARLLGGENITDITLASARELIAASM